MDDLTNTPNPWGCQGGPGMPCEGQQANGLEQQDILKAMEEDEARRTQGTLVHPMR